jgi:hypothetical protein
MSRRSLLLGGLSVVALAACGTSSDDPNQPAMSGSVALVALFAATGGAAQAGRFHRLPFAFADRTGTLLAAVPARVQATVTAEDRMVLGPTEIDTRGEGLPRPYVPIAFRPQAPGLHRIEVELAGDRAEATINVSPSSASWVGPGQRLPAVRTPTTADPRGVSPVCTSDPVCPLHDISLRDAVREGRPVAILVASPGTCAVTYCPPVLDLVVEAAAAHPGVEFVHAEVYEDATDTSGFARTTELVAALGLDFEPSLFIADRTGIIRRRLDHIFDHSELAEALAAVES